MAIELKTLHPLKPSYLESIGFAWHTDQDQTPYIADEVVMVSPIEAQAYADAANTLYDMYVEAAEYAIDKKLYHQIGIPFNLVEVIEQSWQSDVHWHLYGRFDFAGGLDGSPIKLLEFNADTPTSLFETAIIQWALLRTNGLDETKQFNALYEALLENFKRIVTLSEETTNFESLYEGWRFLFSSVRDNIEEEQTVRLLEYIAHEAGFDTAFAYIDEVAFDPKGGIWHDEQMYELFFKLIAWEEIALHEPDLALLLTQIIRNKQAIVFNPAYTLLFQSKGMLALLWQMFPNHPLLLEASFEPLQGCSYVQKPFFGREGANVRIVDEKGSSIEYQEGQYANQPSVYQAYNPLDTDAFGRSYQAGVFYVYEACALGFRRGGKILDNASKFVAHILSEEM